MIFPISGTLTPSKLGGAHCCSPLSQSGTNWLESAVVAIRGIIARRQNNASIAMSLTPLCDTTGSDDPFC